MLSGLQPSPLFYCQPQWADKPTKGKLLGVTMFRQFRGENLNQITKSRESQSRHWGINVPEFS